MLLWLDVLMQLYMTCNVDWCKDVFSVSSFNSRKLHYSKWYFGHLTLLLSLSCIETRKRIRMVQGILLKGDSPWPCYNNDFKAFVFGVAFWISLSLVWICAQLVDVLKYINRNCSISTVLDLFMKKNLGIMEFLQQAVWRNYVPCVFSLF